MKTDIAVRRVLAVSAGYVRNDDGFIITFSRMVKLALADGQVIIKTLTVKRLWQIRRIYNNMPVKDTGYNEELGGCLFFGDRSNIRLSVKPKPLSRYKKWRFKVNKANGKAG